jgi:hypothetical protein
MQIHSAPLNTFINSPGVPGDIYIATDSGLGFPCYLCVTGGQFFPAAGLLSGGISLNNEGPQGEQGESGSQGLQGIPGPVGPPGPMAQRGPRVCTFNAMVDGMGKSPDAGEFGNYVIPFDCTITGWILVADQNGNAVLDVQRTPMNLFPDGLVSLCGSDKPTLASSIINSNLAVSQWTQELNAGDLLQISLVSADTLTRLNLALQLSVPL